MARTFPRYFVDCLHYGALLRAVVTNRQHRNHYCIIVNAPAVGTNGQAELFCNGTQEKVTSPSISGILFPRAPRIPPVCKSIDGLCESGFD
jgi:hypothetical protein